MLFESKKQRERMNLQWKELYAQQYNQESGGASVIEVSVSLIQAASFYSARN